MLDCGFSLITVGENKVPNFAWKSQQTRALKKADFESRYNYSGGTQKANGGEIVPTHAVGYATGFNNIEVIDIDLKILPTLHAQTEWWNEYISFLQDNIADFDDKFVIYKTVNNGYHIIYKCEEIGGNQKIAKLKGYSEAIIETRGKGGYCFIYDKQVSKKDYYNIQEISTKDRDVLFQCSAFYDYKEETIKAEPKEKKDYSGQKLTTWNDYNNQTSAADLISSEFSIVRILKDKYIIKRHGGTSPHSGYIYKDSNCMYLFSTGTNYPHETLLSPFAIYALNYHHGDYSAAAKELYEKGYGSRYVREIQVEKLETTINKSDLNFPLDVFPEQLQDYMLQCNATLDSSIDYMACSMLWLYSVMIGNSIQIEVKAGWKESCNLWISLVGKAGLGKTPSIDNVIFPLLKANNREIKNYIKNNEKFNHYQSLSKEEKKHSEEIKQPKKTQFIANDITLEALVDLHEENKNAVGVFKDELAGWFKDMNKYRAGSDLEFWLSTWSGKSVSMNRKTAKSSFVEKPLIPVLGGIQPSILSTFYTDENKDNGFVDRMLLSFPELEIESYNDNEMPAGLIEWYSDVTIKFYDDFKQIIKFNNDDEIEPHVAKWTPDAKIEWKRIFNKITSVQNSDDENEYMKSMLPKQKSYIPRFALILNSINAYTKGIPFDLISKDSILGAEKISDYFIAMAKKIKVDTHETNALKKVAKANENLSTKERYLAMKKSSPELSKKQAAEILNVSLRQIYKYEK